MKYSQIRNVGVEASCINPLTDQQQKLPARSSDGFVYGVKRRKGKRAALPTIAMPGNCGQTTIVEAFESDQLPNDVEVVIGMESFRKATSRLL